MALRRKQKPTERSKLDATPPWDTTRHRETVTTTGPYDVADRPDDDLQRLDLGSLQIPTIASMDIRIEAAEDGQVAGVLVVNQTGQMRLELFAAPRNEGVWDNARTELKASISSQGGTAGEQSGEFGQELGGKLPAPTGVTPYRFIGVDGPRWLLRAMLAGAPAVDDEQAKQFLEVFRGTVVVRGGDPLPVGAPVPLQLPKELAERIAADEQAQQASPFKQG